MQLFELAGKDRRVDRLRQERVAEAEPARGLVDDEDIVFDGATQRLAGVALGERRGCANQRVRHVAAGRCGQAQHVVGRRVEPRHSLQQQVAQAAGKLAGLVAGDGEELLGEEGVAFGTVDNRVRSGRR
jgi:hypothetical protein